MRIGRNRAQIITQLGYLIEKFADLNNIESTEEYVKREYCVFLSHYNLDKTAVKKIGEYIMKAGIDVYLDENDLELQDASSVNNHKKVTECIQKGIAESTHILCLLSPKTVESWWVPYELGYGEKSKKDICSLKLKELNQVPSYLQIKLCLKNIEDLNNYIKEINKNVKLFTLNESNQYKNSSDISIIEKSAMTHPLSKYLDS